VLLTTHRAEEAERCDRVAIIDQGRVIAEDEPEALRRRLAGDILTLEAEQPERLCAELSARFELAARVVEGRLVIERERGHELVPRLVEALPAGRIQSLSMHRPPLADLFVKLTGRSLRDSGEREPVGPA
jgi:ABC-2 type transport system ATP-binding protein